MSNIYRDKYLYLKSKFDNDFDSFSDEEDSFDCNIEHCVMRIMETKSNINSNVYFVFEKLTDENIGRWISFAKNEHKNMPKIVVNGVMTKLTEGVASFIITTEIYGTCKNEYDIWIAYATSNKKIEMAITVFASEKFPITMHMGIMRTGQSINDKYNQHKGLSLKLHQFCAMKCKELYPHTKYMMTRPAPVMRSILLKNLIINEEVWMGTQNDRMEAEILNEELSKVMDISYHDFTIDKLNDVNLVRYNDKKQNILDDYNKNVKIIKDFDNLSSDEFHKKIRTYEYQTLYNFLVSKISKIYIRNSKLLNTKYEEIKNLVVKYPNYKLQESVASWINTGLIYEKYFVPNNDVFNLPLRDTGNKWQISNSDSIMEFDIPTWLDMYNKCRHKDAVNHLATAIVDIEKLAVKF